MWFIFLMGLLTQALATQVSYQPSGSLSTPEEDKNDWTYTQHNSNPSKFTLLDAKSTASSNDDLIERIFISNREGRHVEGYDELYADPGVKNALQDTNETIARAYIRDKLCDLGLMNCENIEGRRPYFSPHHYDIHPHEVIYAQPVTIKPVGRPLPAIPVKKPFGYGPPKPGLGLSGPPYGPPGPVYGAPGPFSGPPPYTGPATFNGPFSTFKKPGSYIGSKPVYEESPFDGEYDFGPEDKREFIEKKQVIVQPASSVQQHVHHHYHHSDGKPSSVIVGTPGIAGPILSPSSLGGLGNNHGYGLSGTYANSYGEFNDYKKAFKVNSPSAGNSLDPITTSGSYANRYPSYEKPKRDSFFTPKEGGKILNPGFGNSGIGSNNFGNNFNVDSGSFGSNGFDNGLSNGFDDCICVPYDQCIAIDHAGRKDDLFLPIDPRNIGKNIEAESEEVVVTDGNGTMSIIRIPKGVNITEEAQHVEEQKNLSNTAESDKLTKRSKREANPEGKKDRSIDDAQGRLIGNFDKSKLNLKPTWGVSFGLPNSGPYPINPYGGNPLVNPYSGYGGGSNGLNLGIVSVNPLVSVQVSKDEYGDKVVKPFVNLHVTPNQGFVHKLGHILANQKQAFLGSLHGGHGGHYHGGYAPNYYPPHYHQKPQSHYHDHHHHHHHGQFQPSWTGNNYGHYGEHGNHYGEYPSGYGGYGGFSRDNNYYSDDEDYNDFYRSSKTDANEAGKQEGFQQGNTDGPREGKVAFRNRKKREVDQVKKIEERRFGRPPVCGPRHVCCRKNQIRQDLHRPNFGQCGVRNSQGINGRIKTPSFIDGDSEFGEYPWQVAILKKDPAESVYVCGGTLISPRHILTAAHCVKTHSSYDLRARLGEWDVNHDVEFYPYIERDIVSVTVHPEFYAGTLYNDIAILKLDHDVDFEKNPHISPACLPDKHDDFTGSRCWTTGWGKDAFGDFGKYQNILKEVDVPVVSNSICEHQMRRTRLGPSFNLHPGFMCAGGEDGKDACKGDGGGPMICERNGHWQVAGVVSWGIGCGQPGVPGVYARVSYYLDWIRQVTGQY
ncbi:uncharacterized protein [Chelonus insularis]|uniref:uncharacterized protein n=1 Tax=Chelonus insularis TaxID=460826 RepID=UPI00158D3BE5|nr:uncharacterized protein LOC118063873 [Chelonus insularis]